MSTTVALVMNSSNVAAANNTTFRYNFIQGSFAVSEGSEICISSIVIPYSWFNVNAATYNNAVFGYTFPMCAQFASATISGTTLNVPAMINGTIRIGSTLTGGTVLANTTVISQSSGTTGGIGVYVVSQSQTSTASGSIQYVPYQVSLPNGFYQVEDLNNYLQSYFISQGQYLVNASGQNVYFISLVTDVTYYSNQIICPVLPTTLGVLTNPANLGLPLTPTTAQFTVLSSYPAFGSLIGYAIGSYPSTPNSTSYNILGGGITPNLTPVNSIIVRCNLVSNNVGTPSDIMTSFPINSTFGSNINFAPNYEQWVGISTGRYSSITLTLQDQNFNGIQANDVNVLITILIRQPKRKVEEKSPSLISMSGSAKPIF